METLFFRIVTNVFFVLIILQSTLGEDKLITKLEDKVTRERHNTTDEVTIYTESNYWGVPWTMSISNCTDVPGLLYKKASSINTHDNCVILYSREECKGRHVKIAPGTDGHSRLSDVDFDDTLVSLKLCDEDWDIKEPRKEKGHNESPRARRNVKLFNQFMNTAGDDDAPEPEESNSSQQDEENLLMALLQRLNFINRFQKEPNNGD